LLFPKAISKPIPFHGYYWSVSDAPKPEAVAKKVEQYPVMVIAICVIWTIYIKRIAETQRGGGSIFCVATIRI
jgi:hypothetical protein